MYVLQNLLPNNNYNIYCYQDMPLMEASTGLFVSLEIERAPRSKFLWFSYIERLMSIVFPNTVGSLVLSFNRLWAEALEVICGYG